MAKEKKKSFIVSLFEKINEIRKSGAMTEEEIKKAMEEDFDFWNYSINPEFNKSNKKEKPVRRELTKEELEEAKRELWNYLDNPEYIDRNYLESQKIKRY